MSTVIVETVICPKCGKPYPKQRYDLGYKCCVNCSTVKPRRCIIEGIGSGDDSTTQMTIVTQEEAGQFERARQSLRVRNKEQEPDLSMTSYDDEEVATSPKMVVDFGDIREEIDPDGFKEVMLDDDMNEIYLEDIEEDYPEDNEDLEDEY